MSQCSSCAPLTILLSTIYVCNDFFIFLVLPLSVSILRHSDSCIQLSVADVTNKQVKCSNEQRWTNVRHTPRDPQPSGSHQPDHLDVCNISEPYRTLVMIATGKLSPVDLASRQMLISLTVDCISVHLQLWGYHRFVLWLQYRSGGHTYLYNYTNGMHVLKFRPPAI